MENIELLSPAGDMESFKVAIKSGADAVFFGLDKFNARIKAENFSAENVAEVVDYAHLKGVKVYVTINTLVSVVEINEMISLVGTCLKAGVDAFIVQDYGVIYALKTRYPSIVLHGSTQLGVHNVRGARVAKKLGLSRVVLSREVTLKDIREISENVDIELEVFVHGAMCVCFSGNCYLSSIKHNASGNRGECKQLCRLPYILMSKGKSISGYPISPRDNCMLEYIDELKQLGVVSLKIEGRLRRAGYVGVATRVYRDFIDGKVDIHNAEEMLKKVFARGEFTHGYFESNDIIDYHNNSHMGERIGIVKSCERFKDIYKTTLDVSKTLNTGDGLKFIKGDKVITLGVGNVEKNGRYSIVYGKNYIQPQSSVYRVLDVQFENAIADRSRYRVLTIDVIARVGIPLQISVECGDIKFSSTGADVSLAKSRPITKENIIAQVSKVDSNLYKVNSINVNLDDNAFLPLSEINAVRREVMLQLQNKILDSMKIPYLESCDEIREGVCECDFDSLAIVDENADIAKLKEYSALILSPIVFSCDVIAKFYEKYKRFFSTPLLINLPIVALSGDIKIIDDVVKFAIDHEMILVGNNIYALDYLDMGANVIAGSNMNIVNGYSLKLLNGLGVGQVVSSIERWCQPISGSYRMSRGKRVLMTFAHCPHKTLNGNDCSRCSYSGSLMMRNDNSTYSIRRIKIDKCYFELVDSFENGVSRKNRIDDLRN